MTLQSDRTQGIPQELLHPEDFPTDLIHGSVCCNPWEGEPPIEMEEEVETTIQYPSETDGTSLVTSITSITFYKSNLGLNFENIDSIIKSQEQCHLNEHLRMKLVVHFKYSINKL
jgi:hypothetical protein